MQKSLKRLTLPVEIFNREFDAKVLLSCFAAERGFSVIIGAKKEINLNLESLPPSLYLPINMSNRNIKTTTHLAKLGHALVGVDEEAIVYRSPEVYTKEKLGNKVFPQPKLFLAWGPENARIWESQSNYNGMPIKITGNPRTDLLRPELREYWAESVSAIKERFGHIILINTNFGKLNHFRNNKGAEKQALDTAETDPGLIDSDELGMAQHRLALFHHFQEMVAQIGKTFPNHTVLIRPHPSESHETWKQAGKGSSNVHVHAEGHVIPWLLASEAIIHNSCTTGVEGYVLGKPVFSFQPIRSDSFDKKFPNALSHQVSSIQELIDRLKDLEQSQYSPDINGNVEKTRLVENYLMGLHGPFASEFIIDTLEEFDDSFPYPKPDTGTRILTTSYSVARKLKRKFNAQFRMDDPNRSQRYQYLQHIFPEAEFSTLPEHVQRFQSVLGRFSSIKVRPLDKFMFEITPN